MAPLGLTPMNTEERLESLLLEWEERAEKGQPTTAEELCKVCPQLVGELRHRIEALMELRWLSELQGPSSSLSLGAGVDPPPGFRLVRRLGRGGFGEVFEAVGPQGRLALKFIPRGQGADAIEGRALQALKDIRHPNLLPILGVWQTEGHLVIGMELADQTLFDRLQEMKSANSQGIPKDELLGYLRQAAEALDHLHQAGVHHRDVKPQNLFLVGGVLKVGDLGIARLVQSPVTKHTGNLTLAFAAPENFAGCGTNQSDQYALAVSYCLLRGGRLPFDGTDAEVMAGHVSKAPDLSMLSQEEQPAVEKALAKEPADRWTDCRTFAEAIQQGKAPPQKLIATRIPWLSLAVLAFVLFCPLLLLLLKQTPSTPADVTEPVLVRTFEMPESPFTIRSVAVGHVGPPVNKLVALTNGAGGPVLFDVESGKVVRRLSTQAGPSAALAPFTQPFGLVGGEGGSVVLFDLAEGREVRRFDGHTRSVSGVAFSPDGRQLLSGACDGTIRLWQTATGKELRRMDGHEGIVRAVAFDGNGRRALSAGWDGTARLWDLATGKQLRVFDKHSAAVSSIAVSPNGYQMATASTDGTVRLWNLETGVEEARFDYPPNGSHFVCFWNRDRLLATGDCTFRVWSLPGGEQLFAGPAQPSPVNCAVPVGIGGVEHVLAGTEHDGLQLWRVQRAE